MPGHASYHPKNEKHYVVIRENGRDTWVYYRTAEHAYLAIDIRKAAS